MKKILEIASLFTLSLLLAGCLAKTPERKRFFWPIGFEQPRIEYLDFFLTAEDFRRGNPDWFTEVVLGREVPRLLFSNPFDVAADGGGKLYVSDTAANAVHVIERKSGRATRLRDAKERDFPFGAPLGLDVGEAGEVYVVDSKEATVEKFFDGGWVETIGKGELQRPTGIAVDRQRQRIYVADPGSHQVAIFDLAGEKLQVLGRRGGGEGEFNFPLDLDFDAEGNLFVLDSLNARVQVFDAEGNFLRAFGERGTASGSFQLPKGIAVSPSGHVYVTDGKAHHFVIFDRQGRYLLTVGGESRMETGKLTPGGFYLPQGIDIDAQESIWIVDSLNRVVHRFQYLNDRYLESHPILPHQVYIPPELLELEGGRQPEAEGK